MLLNFHKFLFRDVAEYAGVGGEEVLKGILVERGGKDIMVSSVDQLPAADVWKVRVIRSVGKCYIKVSS